MFPDFPMLFQAKMFAFPKAFASLGTQWIFLNHPVYLGQHRRYSFFGTGYNHELQI
jgi:hypothetical protein